MLDPSSSAIPQSESGIYVRVQLEVVAIFGGEDIIPFLLAFLAGDCSSQPFPGVSLDFLFVRIDV